jgi:hypothetical protein
MPSDLIADPTRNVAEHGSQEELERSIILRQCGSCTVLARQPREKYRTPNELRDRRVRFLSRLLIETGSDHAGDRLLRLLGAEPARCRTLA